jgi:Carboxypeptidase regulatory-like domain
MGPHHRTALMAVVAACLCATPLDAAKSSGGLPAWGTEPVPAGLGDGVLNAISVGSASNIWAVGQKEVLWHRYSLTLHYDGSSWTVVPSPQADGLHLEDVVTVGPGDAWAVGWSGSPSSLDDRSMALHWDGIAWTVLPTPQPGGTSVDRLFAVDAAATDDVWATGVYWDDRAAEHSVILHWDGSAWRRVPLGLPRLTSSARGACDTYGGLTGITVVSPADVWAVGDATTCRYDGARWTEVPSPQPRPEYNELSYPLEDVSAASPNDVWAVGARVLESPWGNPVWDTLAEHWDGASWTRVTALPVGQVLLGVDAVAANDAWAVGGDDYGPMIVHYDGASWSRVATPEANRAGRLAGIGSAAPDLWAAGSYEEGALIEHAPSTTQGAIVGHTNVSYATVSWFGPENGSVETNELGDYQVGGLEAGTYTMTATNSGCTPDSRMVTVVAGATLEEDFNIGCSRNLRADGALGPG